MTRTQLIQTIINKFGYKSYLEIGCFSNINFDNIHVTNKVGVDPENGGTLRMTSDDFFKVNVQKFDIIFIDGLHLEHQVDKDIDNSIKFLNPNGTIVMHDCNPAVEEAQRDHVVISDWNGTTWKSFVKTRTRDDIDAITANFDHGCGILRVRPNSDKIVVTETLEWDNLVKNRNKWLRLKEFHEVISWI